MLVCGDKHKLIVCRSTATFVCDTVVAHQSEKIIIANRLVFLRVPNVVIVSVGKADDDDC